MKAVVVAICVLNLSTRIITPSSSTNPFRRFGTMAKLIDEMTVSELRQELGKYRLRKTGKKDGLRRRLEQFLAHKKTINSFLYKPPPASTEDETSPTKRRKLQIDNVVVPSSQPESGRFVETPRRSRVTPRVSPYFQRPNSLIGPVEVDSEASDTTSSDSDDGTNQTQEKDPVQEDDALAVDEEESAELVNRTAKTPVSRRPKVTANVSPYFPKPNGSTDSTDIASETTSSISDEDARTGTRSDTLNSSSAETDVPRQGGGHWALSFYDPRGRRWVKRLEE